MKFDGKNELTCFMALQYQAHLPLKLPTCDFSSLALSDFSDVPLKAEGAPSSSLLQQGINTDSSVFEGYSLMTLCCVRLLGAAD